MAYINVDNNNSKRDIKYLNRDFNNFRSQLINFSKRYFPDSFNDFSPSSPGNDFYRDGVLCRRCYVLLS